jgi:hypothetical protein
VAIDDRDYVPMLFSLSMLKEESRLITLAFSGAKFVFCGSLEKFLLNYMTELFLDELVSIIAKSLAETTARAL